MADKGYEDCPTLARERGRKMGKARISAREQARLFLW
jgi:hypothetical protein